VHTLDIVEEVHHSGGVAHVLCQGTAGGLAMFYHRHWTGE